MADRIPRNFIDDLISRTDIVDLIDSQIKLKKKGGGYRARCPFHNGNNDTSFSVNDKQQFYHCFNCGASGNALTFVMEYEGLEFVDAIETLASKLGLEVPREDNNQPGGQPVSYVDRKDTYLLMEEITKYYQQQLSQHKNSEKVINYLKGRGLSGKTVKHFKIGYAPEGWDNICKRFAHSTETQKQLLEAGMIKTRDSGGNYDFFNDRLMFPILDRRGRVVGFGGRVFDNQEPKYLNSPETPLFHKGKELYGLYQVKQAHKTIDRILVVEGYMDVVALAQYGIDYSVASLGTATTPDHIHTLFRHTSEIVCCFDGDKAGRAAAWRALENALPYIQDGRSLRFMFLADGEDPDSFVQKEGKEQFEHLIGQSIPLSDFLFQQLLAQVDMSSSDSKSKLAQLAIPLISQLNESIFRQMMEERLTKLLGIELEGLQKLLPKQENSNKKTVQNKTTPMRLAISLLLQHPQIGYGLPNFPEFKELQLPGLNILNSLLDICRESPNITTGQLLEHWRETPQSKQLNQLAVWKNDVKEDKHEDLFLDILEKFLNLHLNNKIEYLKQKARSSDALTSEETQQLAILLSEQKQI